METKKIEIIEQKEEKLSERQIQRIVKKIREVGKFDELSDETKIQVFQKLTKKETDELTLEKENLAIEIVENIKKTLDQIKQNPSHGKRKKDIEIQRVSKNFFKKN